MSIAPCIVQIQRKDNLENAQFDARKSNINTQNHHTKYGASLGNARSIFSAKSGCSQLRTACISGG